MHAENIDSSNFGLTDYAVFIILLLISSGIGVYYAIKDAKAKKTARQFLTAERTLHWFPVSISLMASFQSSITILGYPGKANSILHSTLSQNSIVPFQLKCI